MKGKPWSSEEEQQLRDLINAKTSVDVIAVKLGRQPDAIVMKCKRLKLEVVVCKGLYHYYFYCYAKRVAKC